MTDKPQDPEIWPLPKFYFSVEFEGLRAMQFQEVSGLETESQPIEYRAGNSRNFHTIKLPGMMKTGNVSLKKGVFSNDRAVRDWFSAIKMNTIERRAVTIRLLDESGAPTMVWRLANAFSDQDPGQ